MQNTSVVGKYRATGDAQTLENASEIHVLYGKESRAGLFMEHQSYRVEFKVLCIAS